MVSNPPAMRETWVQSLGWEDSLDEGMAIHSSILSWRIPMDRGAWRNGIQSTKKLRHNFEPIKSENWTRHMPVYT